MLELLLDQLVYLQHTTPNQVGKSIARDISHDVNLCSFPRPRNCSETPPTTPESIPTTNAFESSNTVSGTLNASVVASHSNTDNHHSRPNGSVPAMSSSGTPLARADKPTPVAVKHNANTVTDRAACNPVSSFECCEYHSGPNTDDAHRVPVESQYPPSPVPSIFDAMEIPPLPGESSFAIDYPLPTPVTTLVGPLGLPVDDFSQYPPLSVPTSDTTRGTSHDASLCSFPCLNAPGTLDSPRHPIIESFDATESATTSNLVSGELDPSIVTAVDLSGTLNQSTDAASLHQQPDVLKS